MRKVSWLEPSDRHHLRSRDPKQLNSKVIWPDITLHSPPLFFWVNEFPTPLEVVNLFIFLFFSFHFLSIFHFIYFISILFQIFSILNGYFSTRKVTWPEATTPFYFTSTFYYNYSIFQVISTLNGKFFLLKVTWPDHDQHFILLPFYFHF